MQISVNIEGQQICSEVSLVTTREIEINRSAIMALAGSMLAMTDEQIQCPVEHLFAPGVYVRRIVMPKGSTVVGKIHNTEHFNIIIRGECIVFTADEGRKLRRQGDIFVSKAGVQKALTCLEEVEWLTVHVTDKTNIPELEAELATESYDELTNDQLIEERRRLGI